MIYTAGILAPLLGFLITGLFALKMSDRLSNIITCSLMVFSTFVAYLTLYEVSATSTIISQTLFNWINVGDFQVSWAIYLDKLSALMFVVVTTVSLCVHLYSIGYMHHDKSVPRFMAYLSLFTFMMLMLISSRNLLQMFFGWEGVGLTSYLLIGYWYERDSANAAAIKAFVMNRIGDLGFVLGLAGIYLIFGTFDIPTIISELPELASQTIWILGNDYNAFEVIGVLLFIGAMGKSAQLGLHTWLPDAMEGPTPVSALIHAATMVTAGVFLVVRMSPLYEYAPFARDIVIFIGATTALFAGTVALTQNDIKRVIAYSTCSQLGYMFFAAGLSAYSVAMFHLTTHAFFKALLFLGSGSVIHAMSDEQDMRKMGGIWKKIPMTYTMMWIGSLALAGIPFFAGYYSKELVLSSAYISHSAMSQYALIIGISVAFLTAFYSWRLLWMTFMGPPHADEKVMGYIHEAPLSMTLPMLILTIGSIFAGYYFDAIGWFSHDIQKFWTGTIAAPISFEKFESVAHWVPITAKTVAITGIILAILFYGPLKNIPKQLANSFKFLYKFSYNKWYFDELYNWLFIKPSFKVGDFFWKKGDVKTVDGYGPDGVAASVGSLAIRARNLQTGYIYHYVLAMAVGLAFVATWYLLFKGDGL